MPYRRVFIAGVFLFWATPVNLLADVGGAIDVLIIANDEAIGVLSGGLSAFPEFGTITAVTWSSTPNAATLVGYDAVIMTEKYKPVANSAAWSNIIASFAQNGGGVTLGFAILSTEGPPVDYGLLDLPNYSPFTRGSFIGQVGSIGQINVPGHPLISGVEQLTTEYRFNVTVNPGATVVAAFNDGVPLAGYQDVGEGRVVAIQSHYILDPFFLNSGDYMQLYRNAVLVSVPEPGAMVTLAAISLIRRRRRAA